MGLQALNPQAFMIIQVVTQLLEPRAAIHYNADFLLKLQHYFFALSPKEALILVSRFLFDEPLIYYRLFMCLTLHVTVCPLENTFTSTILYLHLHNATICSFRV